MGAVLCPACVKSLGDRLKSLYGVALSALLKKEDLTWQQLKSRSPQEYSSQNVMRCASYLSKESAYVASSYLNNKSKRKKKTGSNEIVCWYSNKKGYYWGDYFKQKCERAKKQNLSRPDIGGRGSCTIAQRHRQGGDRGSLQVRNKAGKSDVRLALCLHGVRCDGVHGNG